MSKYKQGFLVNFWHITVAIVILFTALFWMPSFGGKGLDVSFLGGLQPAPAGGPVVPTELGLIMQYAGDQVVTLPDGAYTTAQVNYLASTHGTYSAGNGNTPNVGGNGTYHGWLIIKAQNKWGATVDLTNNGMNIGPFGGSNQAYRICFIGIAFSNGDFTANNANFLTFAYCKFTFPHAQWHNQYVAAGGTWGTYDGNIINKMVNPNCRAIGAIGEIGTGKANAPYCNYFRLICCTFQDVSNDSLYWQGVSNAIILGTYIISTFHFTDALPNPNPALGFLFHSDAWQDEWGSCIHFGNSTILNGDLQLECNDSGISSFAFVDNWMGGSPNVLATIDEFRQGAGSFTGCVFTRNRGWSGGQYQSGSNTYTASPSYDSGYDAGFVFHPTTGLFELPPGWTTRTDSNTFSSGGGSKPASVTVTAGLITDLPLCASASGDSTNPAATFQAVGAHSYANIITYIGSGRTVTDAVYTNGSNVITSASANFSAGDEGVLIMAPGIPGDCYAHFVNSTTINVRDHAGNNVNCYRNSTDFTSAAWMTIGTGGWN